VISIEGMADHVHLLIGLSPEIALSDMVKDVKEASSRFINNKKWVRGHFSWQRGFGAFSYSRSQLSAVAKYIENQERHHSERSFRDEYVELLRKFDVEYDPAYLFSFIDEVVFRDRKPLRGQVVCRPVLSIGSRYAARLF